MKLQLPIPYKSETTIYTFVETKKPSGEVLALTREALEKTNEYNTMRVFVAGCLEKAVSSDREITDPVSLKSFCAKISNKTLEYLATMIMVDYYNEEDE